MTAENIRRELKDLANPQKAFILQGFFKTGPGEYGEGDIFWGIQVPYTRILVKKYKNMPLEEIAKMMEDPVHEVRMAGGLLLVECYKRSDGNGKKAWLQLLHHTWQAFQQLGSGGHDLPPRHRWLALGQRPQTVIQSGRKRKSLGATHFHHLNLSFYQKRRF